MVETILLPVPLRAVTLPGFTPAVSAEEVHAAYERGRREAEQSFTAQLLQQRADFLELQSGILRSFQQALPQSAADCERSLVALAIEVAERLVGDLPVSAAMVEAAVNDALRQVGDATEIAVTVHPDDLALLQRTQSPLLTPPLKFETAPDLTRGGCLVKTRFGLIDARRETKVQLLKDALAQ